MLMGCGVFGVSDDKPVNPDLKSYIENEYYNITVDLQMHPEIELYTKYRDDVKKVQGDLLDQNLPNADKIPNEMLERIRNSNHIFDLLKEDMSKRIRFFFRNTAYALCELKDDFKIAKLGLLSLDPDVYKISDEIWRNILNNKPISDLLDEDLPENIKSLLAKYMTSLSRFEDYVEETDKNLEEISSEYYDLLDEDLPENIKSLLAKYVYDLSKSYSIIFSLDLYFDKNLQHILKKKNSGEWTESQIDIHESLLQVGQDQSQVATHDRFLQVKKQIEEYAKSIG
jgi:hypothetical protein